MIVSPSSEIVGCLNASVASVEEFIPTFKLPCPDKSTLVDAPLQTDQSFKAFFALSWNIEGLSRNVFNLKHFSDLYQPDLVFLSEPQIHSCNLAQTLKHLSGAYASSLNSADIYDPELPLVKSKAHGGTMVLWKRQYDPCIKLHPVQTTAFLPSIFHPPGSIPSIHIAVYLPTLGRERVH